MNAIQSYSYKPKFHWALLAFCAFLVFTSVGVYATIYEDREVVINNFINLGAGGSKTYFTLLAIGSFWLTIQAIIALRASLMQDRCVVVTSDYVAIPASLLSQNMIEIPFADIARLWLQTDKRSRILHIQHRTGTTKVTQRFFDDRDHFEDFLAQLQSAIQKQLPLSTAS